MSYTVTSNKYEWGLANLKASRDFGITVAGDLNDKAAEIIGLTSQQKAEKAKNGKLRYVVVSEWSRTFLKEIGLLNRSSHGNWELNRPLADQGFDTVEKLKQLEKQLTLTPSNHMYLNSNKLGQLIGMIAFKPGTPEPVKQTNLLLNTLAAANTLTRLGEDEVDLTSGTETRTIFSKSYSRLAAIDPANPKSPTLNDLSRATVRKIDTPPTSYLNSGFYTAISRRKDNPNTPGFLIDNMKVSLEPGLVEFKKALAHMRDDNARTAFAVLSLRGVLLPITDVPINAAKVIETLEREYGEECSKILTTSFLSYPPDSVTAENLSLEPAAVDQKRGAADNLAECTVHQRLVYALTAKPFTILAGGTGTGKTRAAKLVAASIAGRDNVEVVAVGADWTDNRPLLGFRNLLAEGGKTYVAPPALRIILKALGNPGKPHFLILDEMNLSHVERYFADFLSSMESREPLKLHDSAENLRTEDGIPVAGKVNWPTNLFVIGTVNIDETTYMFSPKVLDRAHVIEFKVPWDEIEAGLDDAVPSEIPAVTEAQVSEFMRVAGLRDKTLTDEDHEALVEILGAMHEALEGTRFVFAHRTARECLNFIASAKALAAAKIVPEQDTNSLIDLAILQKALPKLNGAAGTLSKVLDDLIKVADTHDLDHCKAKLESMSRQLKADQFVSFIQ
jgi:hypothetical protein